MPTATCICHLPPGRVELREVNLRAPTAEELLVQNLWSGVSPGTESRGLRGGQAGASGRPLVPGYQAVGRVVEAGRSSGFAPGELVFHPGGRDFGADLESMWGAHASHALVPGRAAFRVVGPAGPETSLAKLAAIAHHGLDAGGVKAGETVAVVGLGLLGQLSARLAALRGAEVRAFDRNAWRIAAAAAAGIAAHRVESALAPAVRASGWPRRGFDVLIDVTGLVGVLDEVVALGREPQPWDAPVEAPSRTIIQGSYEGRAAFDYQQAFVKEMCFFVPRDNTRHDIETVLPLIAAGELDLAPLAGRAVAPGEAPAVYQELAEPGARRLTAVFNWT